MPQGATLIIDAASGPVAVQAQGQGGLHVYQATLETANTDVGRRVTFSGPTATAGSWDGILCEGNTCSLTHATITDGYHGIAGGTLSLQDVNIDRTQAQGIYAGGPMSVTGGTISNTGTAPDNTSATPVGSGILAGDGATITGVTFHDNVREAIYLEGTSSAVGNTITRAGTDGSPAITVTAINGATVENNTITSSGLGGDGYPAVELDLDRAQDFGALTGNVGGGNGLDAIALANVQATGDVTWVTPTASTTPHPLGYLLAGSPSFGGALTMGPSSTLTIPKNGIVKSLGGPQGGGLIYLDGARLDASAGGAVFTSLRDNSVGMQTCPSGLMSDTNCGAVAQNDWAGISLNSDGPPSTPDSSVSVVGATIRYAGTALDLEISPSSGPSLGTPQLSVLNTTIDHSSRGVHATNASVSISGGSVSNTVDTPTPAATTIPGTGVEASGRVSISGVSFHDNQRTGVSAGGPSVSVINNTFVRSGTAGTPAVSLSISGTLQFKNNAISDSSSGGQGAPAVLLGGFTGDFDAAVSGNTVANNGLDAMELSSVSTTADMTWVTATSGQTLHPLGYLGDGDLRIEGPARLLVPNGAVVKLSGRVFGDGGSIDATAGSAVFTDLADTSAGVAACEPPSVGTLIRFYAGCPATTFGGIEVHADSAGHRGSVALTGASVRHARDGIVIDSRATSSASSTTSGASIIDTNFSDVEGGILPANTPASVTRGSMTNVSTVGVSSVGSPISVTGMTFSNVAEGVDLNATGSEPISVINNSLDGVTNGFGIRVVSAVNPTVQGNVVSHTTGPGAPVVIWDGQADFSNAVSNNTGSNNRADVMLLQGVTAMTSMTWVSPVNAPTAHPLGYAIGAGALSMAHGTTLTVPAGALIKAEDSIDLVGARLDASAGGALFTSLRDDNVGPPTCFLYTSCAAPAPGDWTGINISQDGGGQRGSATVTDATIRFARTAVAALSGATSTVGSNQFGVMLDGVTVDSASTSGLTVDNGSSASVTGGLVQNVGDYGIRDTNGSIAVSCTTVTANQGGLFSDGQGIAVHDSNLTGNAGPGRFDVAALVPTQATHNWWGQAGGPTAGQVYGPVDSSNPLASPSSCSTAPPLPPSAAGTFFPLTPARILDTRSSRPIGPSSSIDLQVAGAGGVPASGVSAVVLNVTGTEPTAGTYLTVWPTGQAQPTASNLNLTPGQTVPNLVVAKVGANGRVSIYNAQGFTHVVVDVAGWYSDGSAAAGARYTGLTPARILDTRPSSAVAPDASIDLQVTGAGGVPASGVSAVVLNVTGTEPTAGTYLTVWPTGQPRPTASNLNLAPGQTVPNLVVAKVGANGRVSIYNAQGFTHVVVDVAGWYSDGSTTAGARYTALTPARVLDTRSSGGPIGPNSAIDLQIAGDGGVPASGVSAVVLNVTGTEPTDGTYLTVWPTGQPRPTASNLNLLPGQTVPNLVVAKVGANGRISIYNAQGNTHVVVDVAGWFGADGA